MKNYDNNTESSCLKYYDDLNSLFGWAMLQKLPVINFKQIQDTSKFNERFHKKTLQKRKVEDIF